MLREAEFINYLYCSSWLVQPGTGKYATREFVFEMNKAGVAVLVWTVDDLLEIKKLLQLYPRVAICTNYPERVIKQ